MLQEHGSVSASFSQVGHAFSPVGGCMFLNDGVYGRNKISFFSIVYGSRLMGGEGKRVSMGCLTASRNIPMRIELFGPHENLCRGATLITPPINYPEADLESSF